MACKTCEQPILGRTVAVKAHRAGNEVAWHPKSFTCQKCGDLLADLIYFYHQGNIYCGRDSAEVLNLSDAAPVTKYVCAENTSFHIEHFCCYHCDAPLAGEQYTPDDQTNMPLCLDCYGKYYPEKCQNCQGSISPDEQAVSWGKFHWHKSGAKCSGKFCSAACIQDSRR